LDLEDKYAVDFLPENASHSNQLLGFNLLYIKNSNSVCFSNSIFVNQTNIGSKDFKAADFILNNYKKNKSNLLSLTLKK
jgi:hypothetical protein